MELKINELLRERGLKYSDLASRMGTDQSNLKKSLNHNPKLSTLYEVAQALGVEIIELFTPRSSSRHTGLAIFDGKTYGMTQARVVQLPFYTDYSLLRKDVKDFIKASVKGEGTGAFCGILDGIQLLSLVYDKVDPKFILALFYGHNESKCYIYDKMEYAEWKNGKEAEPIWNLDDTITDIQADIESIISSGSIDK